MSSRVGDVLQLHAAAEHAQQWRRLVDRQVGVRAAVGDDRDVLPGVEPEPGHHPPDQVDAVARQHPEVVPGTVRRARRQGDLEVAGRPWGRRRSPAWISSRFSPHLRRDGVVGHDDRVGQLPVGQRDREPRAAVPTAATSAGRSSAPARSAQRPACQERYGASKSAAALPSPRGCTRRRAVRRQLLVQQRRAPPGTSRPTRCCRSRRPSTPPPAAASGAAPPDPPAERGGVVRRGAVVGRADDEQAAAASAARRRGRRAPRG